MEAHRSALCVEETEDILKELRAAPMNAGITLPSLRIAPASLAQEALCGPVEWGRCPADTAGMAGMVDVANAANAVARLAAALRVTR